MSGATASLGRQTGSIGEGAWQFLATKLPTANLTASALGGSLPQAVGWGPPQGGHSRLASDTFDTLARALYRRTHNHVLITGRKGVGKATVVNELARRAAFGKIAFLANRTFLWLDAEQVGPEESRGCFETLLMACEGRSGLVLCRGALLRRPQGIDNKSLLRAAVHHPGLQLIGVLGPHEYQDLIAGDAGLAEQFTRIEIDEPSEETAFDIARCAATGLSRNFHLSIDDSVVRRAVALSSSYLLSECHPVKAIKVLCRCCDEVDYERSQLGSECNEVAVSDVVRIISGLT